MSNGSHHRDSQIELSAAERRVVNLLALDRSSIVMPAGLESRIARASTADLHSGRVNTLLAEDRAALSTRAGLADRVFDASVPGLPRPTRQTSSASPVVRRLAQPSWRSAVGLAAMIAFAFGIGTLVLQQPSPVQQPTILVSVQQIGDDVQSTSAADFSVADASRLLDLHDVSVNEIEQELDLFEQALALQ